MLSFSIPSKNKYQKSVSNSLWSSPIHAMSLINTYLICDTKKPCIIANFQISDDKIQANLILTIISSNHTSALEYSLRLIVDEIPQLRRITTYLIEAEDIKFFSNQKYKFNFEVTLRNHARIDGTLHDIHVYTAYPGEELITP